MKVVSSCPLRVGSVVWRPGPEAWALTVVCKATYTLEPDESKLSRDQDDVNESDGFWNDDERRSLHTASDLAPFKVRADVLLVGHAFAPRGQPVRSLATRLTVAGIDKSIDVYCDRAWMLDGSLREGARFTRMPLRWEKAAGGPGTANPVGVRADGPPDAHGAKTMPNLQPPGTFVRFPSDFIAPIGFGPIAPAWPGRAAMLRHHGPGWSYTAWSERVVPRDIDARFFNAAPADQQAELLRAGERIVLENLHAEHARLVTNLEPVAPRAVVERAGRAAEEIQLRCDTLCIDTDRGRCTLAWRGQIGLWHPSDAGRVVVTMDRDPAATAGDDAVETIIGGMKIGAALPFTGGAYATPVRDGQEAPRDDRSVDEAVHTVIALMVNAKPALPFVAGQPASLPASPAAPPRAQDDEGTGTIIAPMVPVRAPMPFTPSPAAPAPAPVPVAPLRAFEPPSFVPAPAKAPEPPPMIGPPLVTAPPAAAHAAAAPDRLDTGSFAEEAPAPADAPAAEEAEIELSIEQFAAIAAEIAEEREARGEVLKKHEVPARAWSTNEKRWAKALEDEAARGSSKLRNASDQAYVAAVEGFRGAITLEEYARIVIGLERKTANLVLDDLGIQRAALMRIVRLWTKKVAKDPKLAAEGRALLARMR
jgi:hypothetical protein